MPRSHSHSYTFIPGSCTVQRQSDLPLSSSTGVIQVRGLAQGLSVVEYRWGKQFPSLLTTRLILLVRGLNQWPSSHKLAFLTIRPPLPNDGSNMPFRQADRHTHRQTDIDSSVLFLSNNLLICCLHWHSTLTAHYVYCCTIFVSNEGMSQQNTCQHKQRSRADMRMVLHCE